MYAVRRIWDDPVTSVEGMPIPVLKEAVHTRIQMLAAYTREQLGGLGSAVDLWSFLVLNAISYHAPKASTPKEQREMSAYKHERWLELERTLYIKRVGRLTEDQRRKAVKHLLRLKWRKAGGVPMECAPILLRGVRPSPHFRWWDEASQTFRKFPVDWKPLSYERPVKGFIPFRCEVLTGDFTLDHYLLLQSFDTLCYLQNQRQIIEDLYPWVLKSWQVHEVVPRRIWSMQALQKVPLDVGLGIKYTQIPSWAKPPCIRSLEHYVEHQRHPAFPQRALHISYYTQVSKSKECAKWVTETYWKPACERDRLPLAHYKSLEAEAKCTTENTLKGQCSHACHYVIQHNMCVWADARQQLRDIEEVVIRQPLQELGYDSKVQDECIEVIRHQGRWATQRCSLLQQHLTKALVKERVRSPASFTLGLLLSANEDVQLTRR